MSLKAFHVLFILLSIVLSGGFGCWSLERHSATREILYLFFAGMSNMPKAIFLRYNVIGGLLWVCLFVLSGYFFGNLPIVKERFSLVIVAIVIISLIPIVKEYIKTRSS